MTTISGSVGRRYWSDYDARIDDMRHLPQCCRPARSAPLCRSEPAFRGGLSQAGL
jgi:hypothetical protein